MKSILTIKNKRKLELISLCILIVSLIHYTKILSEKIKQNNTLNIEIKSKNIQFENKLSKQINPHFLIKEIKKITDKNFYKISLHDKEIYKFKKKITDEILIKIVDLLPYFNSNYSELNIDHITNTIEIIIPKK